VARARKLASWFLRAIDQAGRWQAAGGLGLVGLLGVVLVAVLNAVFNLGSPWGYVVFVSFVLIGYALFLWLLERLRATFPEHRLAVGGLWYSDLPSPYYGGEERRVVFVPVEYTNRHSRGVSLRFDLLWRRDVRGQVLGPYRLSRASHVRSDRVLTDPMHVRPDETESGELAFEPHETWLFEYGDLLKVKVRPDYRLSLRLVDHVSGASLERDVGAEA
jgi:hypothetical protein